MDISLPDQIATGYHQSDPISIGRLPIFEPRINITIINIIIYIYLFIIINHVWFSSIGTVYKRPKIGVWLPTIFVDSKFHWHWCIMMYLWLHRWYPLCAASRFQVVQQTQISPLDVDAVESYADGKILDDCLEAGGSMWGWTSNMGMAQKHSNTPWLRVWGWTSKATRSE